MVGKASIRESGVEIKTIDQIYILFVLSFEPFLEVDQAIVEPLPVGHLHCARWPLLVLDLVQVGGSLCIISATHCERARWWVCQLL